MMTKNAQTPQNDFFSGYPGDASPYIQNPSILFLNMDVRALNDSLDKLPVYLWAHSDSHTIVYSNRLARKKFGECMGRLCHECIMGRREVCACCKTEKVLKNNDSEVCHGCKRGGNGHTVDTFHSPVVMKDGSKHILKFSVDSHAKKYAGSKGKGETQLKNLSVTAFRSMCASCKRIKEPGNEWISVEKYLCDQVGVIISHGICRECMIRLYPDIKI
jgi:hypothetical protein